MTIKPLATGRFMPLLGLAFSWSTIREIDMLTLGVMTPEQACKGVDLSLSVLNRTAPSQQGDDIRTKQCYLMSLRQRIGSLKRVVKQSPEIWL